jgi:carbonic anhydrase/acetyltransferase-like protein (isoleucine patch superfamily)
LNLNVKSNANIKGDVIVERKLGVEPGADFTATYI